MGTVTVNTALFNQVAVAAVAGGWDPRVGPEEEARVCGHC